MFVGEVTTGTIHKFGSEAKIGRHPMDIFESPGSCRDRGVRT